MRVTNLMRIVHLQNDGLCLGTSATMKNEELFLGGSQRLFKHLYDAVTGIVLCSTVRIDCPFPCFYEFPLPPPLNAYVLPSPLYMVRLRGGVVQSLSVEEAVHIVRRLASTSYKNCRTNEAVYDVPIVHDGDEPDSEHEEEELRDEEERDSDADEVEGDEEDVEWTDMDDMNDPLLLQGIPKP